MPAFSNPPPLTPPYLNAIDNGVEGNGTVDVTIALQRLLNKAALPGPTGGPTSLIDSPAAIQPVWLGPGDYIVSSPLTVPAGVMLIGAGAQSTRILYSGPDGSTMLAIGGQPNAIVDPSGMYAMSSGVRDLTLCDTKSRVTGVDPIDVWRGTPGLVVIENCILSHVTAPIQVGVGAGYQNSSTLPAVFVQRCLWDGGCNLISGAQGFIRLVYSGNPPSGYAWILDNTLVGSALGNGSTDAFISVDANQTQFQVRGNVIDPTAIASTGLHIAAGASDHYAVVGNDFASATTPITDGGTGTNKTVQTSTFGFGPGGLQGTYNIRNYGAKIDGVTDDSAAVSAAVAAASAAGGGIVFHPGGTCVVNSNIQIPSKVSLMGINRGAVGSGTSGSTFLDTAGTSTYMFGFSNAVQGSHVTGLCFSKPTPSTGFTIAIAGSDVVIEQCRFYNCEYAIRSFNATTRRHVVIRDVIFDFCNPVAAAQLVLFSPTTNDNNEDSITLDTLTFISCNTTAVANDTLIQMGHTKKWTARNIFAASSTYHTGITMDTSCDYFKVEHCDFHNALTAAISDTSTATHKVKRDVLGYNPVGYLAAQPAVPLSGTPLTNNTGVDWDLYIDTLNNLTAVSIGAQDVGFTPAAGTLYRVPAGQTITFTYGATAPTIAVFGS